MGDMTFENLKCGICDEPINGRNDPRGWVRDCLSGSQHVHSECNDKRIKQNCGRMFNSIEHCLKLLSGDLSYDNVAEAKRVMKRAINGMHRELQEDDRMRKYPTLDHAEFDLLGRRRFSL